MNRAQTLAVAILTLAFFIKVAECDQLNLNEIETLRHECPRGPSGLTQGAFVPLPNGDRIFVLELIRVGARIELKDRKGLVTLLTYTRDHDAHMRVIAFVAMDRFLTSKGVRGDDDLWTGFISKDVTDPKVQALIDREIIKRVCKYWDMSVRNGERGPAAD